MPQTINIYDHLSPEQAEEYRQLVKLNSIREKILSGIPLTLAEIALHSGVSKERIHQIEQAAKYKVKKDILTNHPEILK